jgi:hypothetical protein
LPATKSVFPIQQEHRYGAIDVSGTVIVPPRYNGASRGSSTPFFGHTQFVGQEGLMLLSGDQWLYVGLDGAKSIKPLISYPSYVVNLGDALFVVLPSSRSEPVKPKRDQMGEVPARIYDPTGRWRPSSEIVPRLALREGLIAVSDKRTGKCGYADRAGTLMIEPEYDLCSPFCEGLAAVKFGDLWGFVDAKGKMVIQPKFYMVGFFDQGVARVVESETETSYFINTKGEYLFDWPINAFTPEWNLYGYRDGLLVHRNKETGLFGYIDQKGAWVIQPQFDKAFGFEEGLANVRTQRGWQFIDKTGQIQFPCPPEHSSGSHFTSGLCGDRFGRSYINRSGECVWRAGK